MPGFYRQRLWILKHFLLAHPDFHHGLLVVPVIAVVVSVVIAAGNLNFSTATVVYPDAVVANTPAGTFRASTPADLAQDVRPADWPPRARAEVVMPIVRVAADDRCLSLVMPAILALFPLLPRGTRARASPSAAPDRKVSAAAVIYPNAIFIYPETLSADARRTADLPGNTHVAVRADVAIVPVPVVGAATNNGILSEACAEASRQECDYKKRTSNPHEKPPNFKSVGKLRTHRRRLAVLETVMLALSPGGGLPLH